MNKLIALRNATLAARKVNPLIATQAGDGFISITEVTYDSHGNSHVDFLSGLLTIDEAIKELNLTAKYQPEGFHAFTHKVQA
jgi:hypothetical protein